ncbi:hypothetical protein GCM10012275_63680 [Longimycelium tulufanense]|uniref:Uncharacterized protein n=1 Tax=Longimycelium tulufanense TaxID=907463 RepID=A0A8J3FYR8_9PSEU|nr:hypothetical protein [Longimycelium tulufanense]GGM84275.1 hypothetical protein GCM10012275_63680 [Longimycelium tulufanense]
MVDVRKDDILCVFRDLPVLPGTSAEGLLVLTDPDCSLATRPGIARHATWPGGRGVVFVPTIRPLWMAQHVRQLAGVEAITVQPAGAVSVETRIALWWANELRSSRLPVLRTTAGRNSDLSVLPDAFVTGASQTTSRVRRCPSEVARILHLITVNAGRRLLELPVWEWLPRPDALAWFGVRVSEVEHLYQHIPELLWLRRAAREHRLPQTPSGQRLARALGDETLTGRFLLEHHALVGEVIEKHALSQWVGQPVGVPSR